MPLLRKESEIHPETLFALDPASHPWWVAHVRSRREKALARYLLDRGIAFYLPQIEQRVRRSGRDFVSYLPLFSGYVFFRAPKETHDVVWRSDVIANVIAVPDQNTFDRELAQIRELQKSGATLRPHVALETGDAVRITGGAFKGYTGVVMEERGVERLIVSVSLLKKAVAVEFSREVLSAVRR